MVEKVFEEIISKVDYIEKNIPTGAKSLLLLSFFKKYKKIIFIGEEIEEIYEEIKNINPDLKISIYEGNLNLESEIILLKNENLIEKIKEFNYFRIKKGEEIEREKLIEILENEGFERVYYVEEKNEYAARGGIVDFYPKNEDFPLRIEFYGNKIYEIRIFDPLSQKLIKKIEEYLLLTKNFYGEKIELKDFKIIYEKEEKFPFEIIPNPPLFFEIFKRELNKWKEKNFNIFYFAPNKIRYSYLKNIFPFIEYKKGNLYQGFVLKDFKIAVFSEGEIYGFKEEEKIKGLGGKLEDLNLLELGEPVIHEDYGIGYLKEVKIFEMNNKKIDTFVIIFKENQKIYVPFYDIGKIERYSGKKVKITPLGSRNFFIKKLKAKIYAYDFAKKILETMAERKANRKNFDYEYKKEMDEIIISFPYEETEDQEKVWEEVKNDILSDKICDRVICGDVGFGKTEIALRASSLVALNKKQVAILVPTTILAVQHEINFKERLKNFDIRVESLTRLKPQEKQKEIIKGIENGEIDIIIGTHRILQEDIKFKDLGLLIIDDEHRFGIFQKEKIKFFKKNIDTIYLSATPIPRTLFLSLNKIMDLSLLETPPPLKKEVETIITPYNIETIEKAINFELERGGQIIYIYNRIKRLKEIKEKIESIFPEAIVETVCGRMEKEKIEDIFINFMLGKIDILVSTSILEAGVDFPNANTLIVENPHLFGLAELHQIRGRVGRKDKKAYAYFLIPKNIGENAKKRLKAIATYRHLGSGFKIALYDMKLRGAGKILDKKQHGIASSLGYNLFFKILDEEIKRIKGEKIFEKEAKIIIESDVYIPREYIEDEEVIISIYKRLSESESLNEMKEIYYEIKDRFGEIPDELKKIFLLFYLKNLKKFKKLIVIQEGILCEERFYKISEDFYNIFV